MAAILKVIKITFRASPLALVTEVVNVLVASFLPIVTSYFAALTTTLLVKVVSGDEAARGELIFYVVLTVALGALTAIWSSIAYYINRLAQYKIDVAISDKMYMHFLSLEFWRYDDKNTADLYDKASRFARFFAYVFSRISDVLSAIFTLIISLGALIFVNWWLGLLVVIAVIPGLVIQFRISRAFQKHWNSNTDTRRAKNMIEWDLFRPDNIPELRVNKLVKHLLKKRYKLREIDEKYQIDFERKYVLKKIAAKILEASAEVFALVWVVMEIITKNQPIGQFIFVQQVVSRAIGGSGSLALSVSKVDEDIANLFDYQEFMDLPEAVGGRVVLSKEPKEIKLQDVSFKYLGSESNVLENVNMIITKGQHIAIVGENGAGKSTLIKLMTGLYKPSKGYVWVDDNDLSDVSIGSWHQYLGILSQDFVRYNFATAKENVFFGDASKEFDQERFDLAVDMSESREFLQKLPKGFDSYVDKWMSDGNDGTGGIDLSGGQWQRLALARSFYRNSPIIILDEPTSAIDALAESKIFKHLFADKSRTIITVSHRLDTIKKASIIFMLKDGKIVESGSHKELVDIQGEYFRLFESQL